MGRFVTEEILSGYQEYLYEEEKSEATIKKYMRDLGSLCYIGRQEINKEDGSGYKEYLRRRKSTSSQVFNSFPGGSKPSFEYLGWYDSG